MLARHLLQIVFKKEALQTCSIRGIKKTRDDEGRLALHSGAVNAILGNYKYIIKMIYIFTYSDINYFEFSGYVDKYAKKIKWKDVDERIVCKSMAQKLVEIRDTINLNKK